MFEKGNNRVVKGSTKGSMQWKLIFYVFITCCCCIGNNVLAADIMFLILAEKDGVQNQFVTAYEQGMSKVQTETAASSNALIFDQTVVVLDRYEMS